MITVLIFLGIVALIGVTMLLTAALVFTFALIFGAVVNLPADMKRGKRDEPL